MCIMSAYSEMVNNYDFDISAIYSLGVIFSQKLRRPVMLV